LRPSIIGESGLDVLIGGMADDSLRATPTTVI